MPLIMNVVRGSAADRLLLLVQGSLDRVDDQEPLGGAAVDLHPDAIVIRMSRTADVT